MRVCIVGASGKLGTYTVKLALDRRWTVVRGSSLEEGAGEGLPV